MRKSYSWIVLIMSEKNNAENYTQIALKFFQRSIFVRNNDFQSTCDFSVSFSATYIVYISAFENSYSLYGILYKIFHSCVWVLDGVAQWCWCIIHNLYSDSHQSDNKIDKYFFYITLYSIVLHYITLHCIALHYITSHHITSHHIKSHHITSHHITSNHITSHHITSHQITSHHITSHHITSHHITSHYITLHHITSHHFTSHHITLHYITLHYYMTWHYITLHYYMTWHDITLH